MAITAHTRGATAYVLTGSAAGDLQTASAATVAAAGANPTKAEYDTVVALVNDLRQLCINAGLCS